MIGKTLGPYQLVDKLGEGGMGEVYRARDTRLDRSVAIKVLAADIANDPATRARFEREAKAIAALDHPHICSLYDVGEADGTHFLVMPLLDGQTLAARLDNGAVPLDQALSIGIVIADALDKAHRQGIVHRDLKPGNIMLTRSGVKLLDFGLAKLRPTQGPISMSGMGRLATTTPGTAEGMILGTVPYMAPEQVEGKEADARSDLWALGALLYEMLTGTRAFVGESPASVIGSILKDTVPPVSQRQPLAPAALDHIVARCLEKDRDERWQNAGDVKRELEWVRASEKTELTAAAAPGSPRRPSWWLAAAALIALAAAAVALATRPAPQTPVRDVRFTIYPEHGSQLSLASASIVAPQFALSRDGESLAFVATSDGRDRLWVRRLSGLTARALPGTEEATFPFWSPDARSIGFFAQGKLKIVNVDGGTAVTLSDASYDPRGGAWAPDGTMLVSQLAAGGLSRVTADGATTIVAPLDEANGETSLRWPSWLPDSTHFVVGVRNVDDRLRGIYLGTIDGDPRTFLNGTDWGAAVVDGYLLFLRGRTLMAQPLDVQQRRLTGDPIAILDDVAAATTGHSAFSVSATGTLAYSNPWPTDGELRWFDRRGQPIGDAVAPLNDYVDFALSPDATRLAISRVDPQVNTADIWVRDLARTDRREIRLTSDRHIDASPMWSTDASKIYFRSNRLGVNHLYVKPADASRPEELLIEGRPITTSSLIPSGISRDGSRILFTAFGLRSSWDTWSMTLTPTTEAKPLLEGPFNEYQARLSPDGRWLVYVSNEGGPQQVYLQSFPEGSRRQQVSSRGGSDPQWRSDGQELFFLGPDRVLMAAPIDDGIAGVAGPLFQTRVPISGMPYRVSYAPSADGQRFLVNTAPPDVPPQGIRVILDWRALINERTR